MEKHELMMLTAHEMKNPLASIHGYAELINYGIIENSELVDTAKKIKIQTEKIDRMINDLMYVFGIEEIYNEEKQEQELRELCREASDALKHELLAESEIEIKGQGKILCNTTMIKHMIKHLLENAIIYNDNKRKKVECLIEESHNAIMLTITDNGKGIEDTDKEKVFECFYRVDKKYSRERGGNGLGLYVCKMIAGYHNADIFRDDLNKSKIGIVFFK